jgi:hypothetical protein
MSDSTRWISVGELAHAFAPDNNTPRSTDELAGRTLELHLENGQIVEHGFETDAQLTWVMKQGSGQGREAQETYTATKVRDQIYFVDFVRHLEKATTVSLMLDLNRGIVTALLARLPDETQALRPLLERAAAGHELTAVSAVFISGAVDTAFTADTPRHPPTSELVGRRVEYTYSPTERYEHIYLNERFYTWHCLQGSEKGLTDTDRCHYFKLAPDLFLFVWREKIVPTLGAVVVDFDIMRTVGKILGYAGGDFSRIANFAVGAHARVLNVTRRDEGAEV